MIEEVRGLTSDRAFTGVPPFRVGAAAALRPLPAWKRSADFLFAQVSFSLDALLRWRDANPVDVPVFAGVMVLASEAHARRLAAVIREIDIPGQLIDQVRAHPLAGVEAACEQVVGLRDSGAFDGVHLIPVGRYREVAARLEQVGVQRSGSASIP
jgi:methylenetetrahydrofolate reductase (NADPH)